MEYLVAKYSNGTFKDQWRAEWDAGLVNLKKMENDEKQLELEITGKEIRHLFERKN